MRLIDGDALQKLFNDVSTSLLKDAQISKDAEHAVRAFIMTTEMIQDAPTVDAVPVVRCKDCVYWGDDDGMLQVDGKCAARCKLHVQLIRANHGRWLPSEDDFCSCGKRKEVAR